MPPDFLTLSEVLLIHADQVERYGGDAGIRDLGLLESALAQPQATFDGELLHVDLFEIAAAYLYHIVQNHPFVDGNKRTGAVAAILFLEMNGLELDAPEDALSTMVLSVASAHTNKAEIAEFFRAHHARCG